MWLSCAEGRVAGACGERWVAECGAMQHSDELLAENCDLLLWMGMYGAEVEAPETVRVFEQNNPRWVPAARPPPNVSPTATKQTRARVVGGCGGSRSIRPARSGPGTGGTRD